MKCPARQNRCTTAFVVGVLLLLGWQPTDAFSVVRPVRRLLPAAARTKTVRSIRRSSRARRPLSPSSSLPNDHDMEDHHHNNETEEETVAVVTSNAPDPSSSTVVASVSTTVTFPSYAQLLGGDEYPPGRCATSQPFTVTHPRTQQSYGFCVQLYPRGADAAQASAPIPPFLTGLARLLDGPTKDDPRRERVAVYLQYLPPPTPTPDEETNGAPTSSSVDVTFALRLRGRQVAPEPRFDVEWRAGLRFVPADQTQLRHGQANDFGAHLMQTILLDDFCGVTAKDDASSDPNVDRPLECHVEVALHEQRPFATFPKGAKDAPSPVAHQPNPLRRAWQVLRMTDVRAVPSDAGGGAEPLRVGQVVVPVLRRLSERPAMFRCGAYPGVEYRLMRMVDARTGEDVFFHQEGQDLVYHLKPLYPLVPQLERSWPVQVPAKQIPKLLTATQYITISAIGSLGTALTGLATAWALSQMISVFVIPSRSMEPTLQVGDALLVEKLSPRLFPRSVHEGEVVLFHPPATLQEMVARSGGAVRDRDLFVKRVAATHPGDVLTVSRTGDVQIRHQEEEAEEERDQLAPTTTVKRRRDLCTAEPLGLIERLIAPGDQVVAPGTVFVLGDCASVSVDSRVWGGLPRSDIVGRPLLRIWPLSRWGPVGDLPTADAERWQN